MRFFRDLSVQSSRSKQIMLSIRTNGFSQNQGRRIVEQHRISDFDMLFQKDDLTLKHTRPENGVKRPAVCSCGDQLGAQFYAWHHNQTKENTTPIIIEFEANVDAVAIDSFDFLYTIFQWGIPDRCQNVREQIFGNKILRYAEKAWNSENQDLRIALCDLATFDPDLITAHHENNLVIGARYGITYRSAFTIALPLPSSNIIRIWSPNEAPDFPPADVSLDYLIRNPGSPV